MTNETNDAKREAAIREIALSHLRIETLDVRGRDALDFHDLMVINVRTALIAAYEAGRNQRRPRRAKCPACGRTIELIQIT